MSKIDIIMILVVSGLHGLLSAPVASAACSLPHTLKGGDTVSADVLNELFQNTSINLAETMLGTWTTQCWDADTDDADDPGTGLLTVTSLTSITFGSESPSGDTCIFGRDNNGMLSTLTRFFTKFTTIGDKGIIATHDMPNSADPPSIVAWNIIELCQNEMLISSGSYNMIKLSRQNPLPEIPSSVSGSASGTTVTVTWTDNSSDETSFSIVRKSSASGSYSEVGTVSASTTTYSETVTAGTYWYRVRAVNSNGTSLGSTSVLKVTVE